MLNSEIRLACRASSIWGRRLRLSAGPSSAVCSGTLNWYPQAGGTRDMKKYLVVVEETGTAGPDA